MPKPQDQGVAWEENTTFSEVLQLEGSFDFSHLHLTPLAAKVDGMAWKVRKFSVMTPGCVRTF